MSYLCLFLLASLLTQATCLYLNNPFSSILVGRVQVQRLSVLHSVEPKSSRDHVTSTSLRNINHSLKLLVPLAILASTGSVPSPVAAADGEAAYIDALATLIAARTILAPTQEYVELQAYDAARTNAQYILNQLQFQKCLTGLLRSSIDFSEDMDLIEQAQDAANRITNTLIQFDSSVYTCIFIPSDEVNVPDSAVKYRKEANNYYKAFNADIATLLKLGSAAQLESAQRAADAVVAAAPKVLFKKVYAKTVKDPKLS